MAYNFEITLRKRFIIVLKNKKKVRFWYRVNGKETLLIRLVEVSSVA